MSQSDVLLFLKKNKGKYFSAEEISIIIKVNLSSTGNSLRKLRQDQQIGYEFKKINSTWKYIYRHKK